MARFAMLSEKYIALNAHFLRVNTPQLDWGTELLERLCQDPCACICTLHRLKCARKMSARNVLCITIDYTASIFFVPRPHRYYFFYNFEAVDYIMDLEEL